MPDTPAGARYRLHNKLVAKRILAANRVRNEFASWKRRQQSRNINNRYVNDLHSDWSARVTSVGSTVVDRDGTLPTPPLTSITVPKTDIKSSTNDDAEPEEPQEAVETPQEVAV